jgi:hypothetical protein
MKVSLAAGFAIFSAVMMTDETGGAEGEEGEDPIDRADNRRADGPGGQRFSAQAADHGCLADIEQRLARLGEHGRNAQGKNIAQSVRREVVANPSVGFENSISPRRYEARRFGIYTSYLRGLRGYKVNILLLRIRAGFQLNREASVGPTDQLTVSG